MSRRIKMIAIPLIALIVIGIVVLIINVHSKSNALGYKIEFPGQAYNVSNTELDYNLHSLQENVRQQLKSDSVYIYTNPKLTDYKIAEDFGFEQSQYKLYDSNERFYKAEVTQNKNKTLKIDQYGCFTYTTGISDTAFETPYNEQECLGIAKTFLGKYNLLVDNIDSQWSTSETWLRDANSEIRSAITVNLFRKETDNKQIGGNSRISVEINGNGEVVNVFYNYRNYQKRQKVDIISVKKAFDLIREGQAFINLESSCKKLVFERVLIEYYTQDRNPTNTVMQPIYVFQGMSVTTTGETEPFTITVQANNY